MSNFKDLSCKAGQNQDRLDLPGLDAELVLDEESDDEEDHSLHSHGKEVFPHHVPLKRRAEPVLTWNTTANISLPVPGSQLLLVDAEMLQS